jgi:hypothetical protein
MSFTYDLTTENGRVRLLVGATDVNDPLVTDEEIAVFLAGGALAQASERLAAAEVAAAIATTFIRRATSISEGGASVTWGDQAKRYRDLADSLRAADAAADDASGLFDWAEMAIDPFGAREILANDLLRSGL